MKNVLMISYPFPPWGAGATIRIRKFVKYLPEFGWNPIVLTIREEYYSSNTPRDYDALKEIPKTVRIIRTRMFKKAAKFTRKEAGIDETSSHSSIKRIFLTALHRIGKMLIVPDIMILWLPFVIWESLRVLRTNHIDVIYAVGPPHSTLVIGAILKKLTRLPTVLDIKDDWTTNPEQMANKNKIGIALDKWLERFTIKNVDKIIVVTQRHLLDLEEKYSGISNRRFILIPNGFDREDFEIDEDCLINEDNKFLITHAGLINERRNPLSFFHALKGIQYEHANLFEELKVLLIGIVHDEYKEWIKKLELQNIVKCIGNISHKECIKYLQSSSILLAIPSADEPLTIPGKIYEYMAIGKPILMLSAEECAASDLIKKHKVGTVVPPDDVDATKSVILKYYDEFKKGNLQHKASEIILQSFDRRFLTFQLSKIFDEFNGN